MSKIKIGIIGVGNCASSLLQGIAYYTTRNGHRPTGLMHWDLGGYDPSDIEVAVAFDVDARKVGRPIGEAIFQLPNCTTIFCPEMPRTGVTVQMGPILDGVSEHLQQYPADQALVLAKQPEPSQEEVVKLLQASGADMLLNYLPVGSEQATRFYAECALAAGLGFVNCIPVFIASDPNWAARFKAKRLPIIGDDIKAQLGATITHRTLTDLFRKRGVTLERTYQLNTGGNTDFLNMLNRSRLVSKKHSKTEAVQSVAAERLEDKNIHIGPSDYVPWQKDNKICFIRMEGKLFGGVPMNLELRLSVEDSPNSAGVTIDAIRCLRLALDQGKGGVLDAPSAYFMKHPPRQSSDDEAYHLLEAFIRSHTQAPRRIRSKTVRATAQRSRLRRRARVYATAGNGRG